MTRDSDHAYLSEYLEQIRDMFVMVEDIELKALQNGFESGKNLLEGLQEFDISCLKGHALIIPISEIKDASLRQDHMIIPLDSLYTRRFE